MLRPLAKESKSEKIAESNKRRSGKFIDGKIADNEKIDTRRESAKTAGSRKREEVLRPLAKENQKGFGGNQHTGSSAKLPKDQPPIDTRRESAKTAGVGERTYDAVFWLRY